MKIGLYFGSFNPVHNGHCIIASHVLANTDLQQVWLVVSPHNPLKETGSLLNEYTRLHLVQLALTGEQNLKASDVEFHLPRPSYTIDTLTYLSEKYPKHEFAVIMGSDSFRNIKRWKNYQTLQERYGIFVYQRPGFDISDAQNTVKLLQAPLLDISSTHIRENIRQQKSIRYLVPDEVRTEIEKAGYYQ